MSRGCFITLEGTEGVGKSTNVDLVQALVTAAGHECVVTREPGGTPLAEEIRDLLLRVREESVSQMSELLLMFAARAQHIEHVIEPALARGDWVVCDRFTDATYAYQGGGRGMDVGSIEVLERLVQGDLQPDLTIYLDVTPEIAAARIRERDLDRFEQEERIFFDTVRTVYQTRAQRLDRFRVVDAGAPLDQVQADVRKVLARFLAGKHV
ncbi:MAG: dTMP kinase [Pseudomonadales bacterium]|nr:dTMP kinase [Pseudomonadales bacterium]MDP6472927.1 dTMP kinase [Pseudomonadales bacterium]MDP6826316.1 dTMP kinase [Pseudomonadales bacterium]MDP6972767.1 dTMP kinase [Pseudomonadales bacterium]